MGIKIINSNKYTAILVALFLSHIYASDSLSNEPKYEEVTITGQKNASDREKFRTGQTGFSLAGDELRLQISNTLGESLANLPGVHNASFGPSVGLPVLRGLSGVRVRIIEDDIGSWDASALSPDHAIAIEPVLAERIEVLQGASTIEYGSNAIGGVVAVDTQRIPITKTGRALSGSAELRQELLNDHQQTTAVAKLNGETEHYGFHIDGFKRSHNNVSIPGCAIDTNKVIEQFSFDASQSNTCDYIANSDADAKGASLGAALTQDKWFLGASARELKYNYGIPPGSHTEPRDSGLHAHADGDGSGEPLIRIDLKQLRYDLSAGYRPDSQYINRLGLLLAKSDYEHVEAENGGLGTTFKNDVTEGKLRLEHLLSKNIEGVAGVQIIDRFFAATGIENFLPPTDVKSYGIFVVEKLTFGSWVFQLGGRFDNIKMTQRELTAPLRPDNRQLFHQSIDYDTGDLQLGLSYTANTNHHLSLSLGRFQRAPDVHEILALGPHLATRTYDIGMLIRRNENPLPKAETFQAIDFNWTWQNRLGLSDLKFFYTEVSDFIFQANTGFFYDLAEQSFRPNCVRLAECLPVYEYSQSDAVLTGFEWRWSSPSFELGRGEFKVELFSDYIKGRLTSKPLDELTLSQPSYSAIPRLPPWRFGTGLNWSNNAWLIDLRWTGVAKQDKPGAFETTTDNYSRADASVHYIIPETQNRGTVFLKGKNLTNQVIRSSTSFIRNFAPEPGRSFELGIRWNW